MEPNDKSDDDVVVVAVVIVTAILRQRVTSECGGAHLCVFFFFSCGGFVLFFGLHEMVSTFFLVFSKTPKLERLFFLLGDTCKTRALIDINRKGRHRCRKRRQRNEWRRRRRGRGFNCSDIKLV